MLNVGVVASQILFSSIYGGFFAALIVATVSLFDYNQINPAFRPIDVPIDELNLTVDFIVVGAGTAGNVVVNRLTEIGEWNVLLLEAGDSDETVITDVPLFNYFLWHTSYDWNYTTTPQPYACRVIWNSTCYWPRGRIIGGSSVINDFAAIRGNRIDYDGWASGGATNWSYADVLPFFRRLEDNRYPPYAADREYHGVGGYMTIERPTYYSSVGATFPAAGIELGYNVGDLNAAYQTGFMVAEGTLRDGRRCSTAKAYLRPARNRTNIQVSWGSVVTKILIGSNNRTAYGVQFTRNGKNLTAYCTKEVILSAGTINSPQLLMLSGIGPQQQLTELNIPVIADLPVGMNMQDHIGVPMAFTVNVSTINAGIFQTTEAAVEYALNRTGPLSSPVGVESIAFMNPPNATDGEYPQHEIVFTTYPPINPSNVNYFISLTFYLRYLSRGYIILNSSNPFDRPIINPMYLSVPSDVENLIAALQNAVAVCNTRAFQAQNCSIYTDLFTACLSFPTQSYSWYRCLATNYSTSIYHPGCTCRIGSVTDPQLRVYGIRGLRVIDASIMPSIPSGNINVPTIMIGERGADFIRRDYGVSTTVLHDGNGPS
ncbi:uncharacterized GMC-type oxidoreductase Mb1310 [Halyomorpha halys]|uniref:uncharacterized GMC-type oxidoreductase Mb1310 n=1 Tax=Halyomorpha halys TaxID=286706 RepID=UPI0006D50550|nr:uncharacterized protein LOC106689721 [Halyomorpha halys]